MKRPLVMLMLVAGVLASADASALDAWRDRRGGFIGIGVGGGQGTTNSDLLGGDDSGVGLMFLARGGGGVSKKLTLDASVSRWAFGTKKNLLEKTATHWLAAVAANFYLTKHLFARGGLGIGQSSIATTVDGTETASREHTGLGFVLGGGMEFFLNANVAASFTVQAQQQFSDANFTSINGVVGLTWY